MSTIFALKGDSFEPNIKDTIRFVNADLDPHEKIYKMVIVQDEWTVENSLLTPSFKIKRNQLEKKYAALYPEWDNSKTTVIRQS